MAKTIAISDEVYELLRKAKLPGESFSKVIKRSVKRKLKLTELAGSKTLTRTDWEEVQKVFVKAELTTAKQLAKRDR